MKKTSIILTVMMLAYFTKGQEIKLQVFVDQKCNDIDYVIFFLIKNHQRVIDDTIVRNQVTLLLHDTGTYYFYQFPDTLPYHKIKIEKIGEYSVKINPKIISIVNYISNPISEYLCCGEKCNGSIIDYYPNGQIRIMGTFKAGQPIDTINEYYLNGNLLSRRYFPKGKRIKSVEEKYYQTGVLRSCFDKYERGFVEKKYDANGMLVSMLTYKDNFSKIIL